MSKMRVLKSVLFVILFTLLLTLLLSTSITAETEKDKSEMQLLVDNMHPGWNLGNTLDATGSETSWGNPLTTQELINEIADAGFKSIRIPITWNHRTGNSPPYNINPAFLDRVEEVVNWALDADLYVMINLHHEEWIRNMENNRGPVQARYDAIWTQIAERFKDYPDTLMFEAINEPRFSNDWNLDRPIFFEMLHDLNTSFHSIVRSSGGNNVDRPLVLSTLTGSGSQARIDQLYDTISGLNDDNIIATIHYYGFWPFSVNIAGFTTFNDETRQDLEQTFDRAYDRFVAEGIPVVVGEYGLLGFDRSYDSIQRGEILKFFEYMNYYGLKKEMALMVWDNGQHYDRRNSVWRDPKLYEVIVKSVEGRSSTSESDLVFVKENSKIRDIDIKLNLNGNKLEEIKHENTVLKEGRDYKLNGDILTLKSNLVRALITEEYGVNAILTCVFSAGADWDLHIIYYDTPVVESYTALRNSYWIPTHFKGDQLATIEAIYLSGGNAGPQNWTSYKEWGDVYRPNYSLGRINLTSNFFSNNNFRANDEVLVKLHFWSGEVVEYSLIRNGTTIVGTAFADAKELLESYIEEDKVRRPLTNQLSNSLQQAYLHSSNGNFEEAINHLNKFLEQINNPDLQSHIESDAKAQLISAVEYKISRESKKLN